MIVIKKIIAVLLIFATLLTSIPYTVLALSWDGDSAGGSTNAVNGSSTGYVIRSTSDSAWYKTLEPKSNSFVNWS